MKRLAVLVLLSLTACGNQQMLTPKPGQHLPVKPETTALTPTASQLLTPSPRARPGRSDELLIRSQVRRDDKFDLPPQ
jgi:hypothetical protein